MLHLSELVTKIKDSMTGGVSIKQINSADCKIDVLSSFGFDEGEAGGEAVTTGRPVDDELEIDDSLSVQDKIVKYLQSDLILHR